METSEVPKKRKRTGWKDTAPIDTPESEPAREVCLHPEISVFDLQHDSVIAQTCIVLTHTAYCERSQSLRSHARSHVLYPIVIQNEHNQSKRGAQAALRRLECLLEWQYRVLFAAGDDAPSIIQTQIRHGLSRLKSRRWQPHTPESISPVVTPKPEKLAEIFHHAVFDLDDIAAIGGRRTTRVYDTTGECVWCVPISTINALAVSSAELEAFLAQTQIDVERDGTTMTVDSPVAEYCELSVDTFEF